MLFAGAWLLPNDATVQFRSDLDLKPSLPSLLGSEGELTVLARSEGEWRRARLRLFCRGPALFCVDEPLRFFPLGTDSLGRDRLSRIARGGLISLTIATGATALSLGIGLLTGLLAALGNSWLGAALTLIVDVGRSLPWLLLVLALRAQRPLQMAAWESVAFLILILGLGGWFSTSRLVRMRALQALAEPWAEAARGLGLSRVRIGLTHVSPHLRPVLVAQGLALVPAFVLAETSLSFLGLGIADPLVSWGSLLAELRYRDVILSRQGAAFVLLPLLLVNLAYLWTAKSSRSTH